MTTNNECNPIAALSGAFDIIHAGHIRMFKGAAQFGRVVIILNSDDWVKRNKAHLFMPWEDRREVLLSIKYIDEVIKAEDEDDTVCKTLEKLRPMVFCNGGPKTKVNTPERKLCLELGIKLAYGIGGGEGDQTILDIENIVIKALEQ